MGTVPWVWVKVLRPESDSLFLGRLLNEPVQNVGVHEGEMVYVDVSERTGRLVAVCVGKRKPPDECRQE